MKLRPGDEGVSSTSCRAEVALLLVTRSGFGSARNSTGSTPRATMARGCGASSRGKKGFIVAAFIVGYR